MSDVPDDTLPEVLSKLPVTAFDRFSKRSKGIATIPDDILCDILSRLPVPSLLRLRRVCKSWKALIESPFVINQHLNHSRRRISNFKIIPSPGIGFPLNLRCYIVYGFGYDSLSDDYKLVRIVQPYEPNSPAASEVKVYSVKHNSWKQIADFPYYLKVRWVNGEFVNGALHWIVGTTGVMKHWHDNYDCLIGAFDLETEDYRLVPLPKLGGDDKIQIIHSGALGGCLTIVCDHNNSGKDPFEFWVMKEYGVVESWSILFTLPYSQFHRVARCWRYSDVIRPIAYSDCGRKVLVGSSRGGLMWYDLDTKSFDKQVVKNMYDVRSTQYKYLEVYTCLKSLVLLNDSIYDCDFDMVTKTEEEKYGKYRSPSLRLEFLRSWFGCDDD